MKKKSTKLVLSYLFTLLALVFSYTGFSQSVLNPNDTVITYNANATKGSATNPNVPGWGSIQKWIRTVRLNWNTDEWKCYVYNGLPIRLKYPKSYNPTANDGKKYPLMIFFHGAGEAGPVTDNEYSLANGGPVFTSAVDNGQFDGYILVLQTPGNGWSDSYLDFEKQIADYMIANNKVDPFHIIANGLSAGGYATWGMIIKYPQYICTALPMSGVAVGDKDSINNYKFSPMWLFQGGLDQTVDPNTAQEVVNYINAGGGNLKYTLYPQLGHGTWTTAWAEPDFWPWCNRQYGSNPYTLFGRTQFCPGDPINVTVGVAPYFNAYKWRKNGVIIPGATSRSINVTDTGTYDCQMLLGTNWSDWSHTPVVISIKKPTVTPPIQVNGLMSRVIPSLSSGGVSLKVPAGYVSYTWQKVGDTTTIGTDSSILVTRPGNYIVKVTEQFGCSSSFSTPFAVIDSAGPNKPDTISSLVVSPLSQTSLLLNWSQNPTPVNNETGFEIYQATKSGGPYTLAAITAADAIKDTIKGLNAGVQYYYVIRAVDNTGASARSGEVGASTIADVQPPTAPGNLVVSGTQRTSVSLSWGASTDNIGVVGYDIYVNGAKAYTVPPTQTSFTIYSLIHAQTYSFVVKARDQAGNNSPASNQVSAQPLINGLSYSYYNNLPTTIAVLPDFGTLAPAATGIVPNVSLNTATAATDANYYAFLWQGYIIIPTTGNYTFQTTSDDGSRMWLGALNSTTSPYTFSGTPLINNDRPQGSTAANSTVQRLTAGIYPIAIGYFQQGGGVAMSIAWKTPSSPNSFVTIPNSAFIETSSGTGTVPAAPSNLKATAQSYNKVSLKWTDNSSNETGFEVWRSTSLSSGYTIMGTTAAAATTFIDSTVAANTHYYYQVRSINLSGASAFTSNYEEAEWDFNNSLADSTGNNKTLTAVGTLAYDNTTKQEGGYSLKLNGTNQAVTINNSNGTVTNFLEEVYSQRTIAFWMKASATSGTNKVIFDIGGSDDGLALLLNSNKLIAAVASNNVRSSITANYTSTAWNHIAVVYNGDSLLLYVNGALVASTTSLSFHATTTTTNGSRIGETNGTNAYNTTGTFFGGNIDAFSIYNTALGAAAISDVMNNTFVASNATTAVLPAAPAAPTGLTATAASATGINLSWTNHGTTASGIQLYRSNGNNQNYYLLQTLSGSATSFSDAGLYSNAQYYYKINALNAGGVSAYSNEVNATTKDVVPVLTDIPNTQARYGTTTTIAVQASSVSAGLTLSALNLPAFASLVDNGNGSGSIVLNPAAADQGTYNGIKVIAKDAFGGADTTTFNLAVNNNFAPTMDSVASYTMNENDTLSIPLNGHNINASDVLTISVNGLPKGSTVVPVSNGSALLSLHPDFSAAGVYNVKVTVNDNNGLLTSRVFVLTVKDKDPSVKIYSRVQYATVMGAPWNNMTGPVTNSLKDQNGATTNVGINFLQSWWMPFNAGPTTGNNSGVYPDGVMSDFWYFGYYGGPETAGLSVTGLNPSGKYNLTFYAGSNFVGMGDNGTTIYTIGSQSASLYVQGNTQNTVTIGNLSPDATGNITVNMKKGANTPIGYLNALVVTQLYDDGAAPAGPGSLTATNVSGKGIQLNWLDSAYNETGYEIYRSTNAQSGYSLLGTAGPAAVNFLDSTVSGTTQYYYTVRAVNTHGASGYSDTASLRTTDRIPQLTAIADVQLKNSQDTVINIVAVDDPTDHVTLTVSGLPSFASFTDNGNGTGTISIQPTSGVMGAFTGITVTATDNSDSSRSTGFNLYVVDANVSSTYVNITNYNYLASAPWNNMAIPFLPYAGTAASNLVDDGNNQTGITVTLAEAWDGVAETGMRLRNGSNVYPEAVERTSVYTTNSNVHHITVTGLSASKTYNFLFFGSHGVSESAKTNYTIGSQTVSLDGSYNSNQTVQINGVTTSNGTITINVAKDASAVYALLSAMVIESYNSVAAKPLAPADLRVLDYSMTNKVSNSIALQWQDRASNETGYEVWRANDGGSYAKIATLAANVTTYTDNNLTANASYNYTVRTVNGSNHSDYCAAVKGHTYGTTVYINFNSAANAVGSPWNNLNWVYGIGSTWSNFVDETGAPTNLGMIQPVKVDGMVSPGVNTGNNSGIFPDKVMAEGFGMFPGDTTAVVLTGLNVSQTYELTIFASLTNYIGDNTTVYLINGQTCLLNSMNNKTGVLTIHGIVPDASGTATLSFSGFPTATFGLLGAMVVRGYSASSAVVPTLPISTVAAPNAVNVTAAQMIVASVDSTATNSTTPGELKAYPNPFDQYFMLTVPATDNDKVIVSLTSVSGQILYQQVFDGLYTGNNQLRIQPSVQLMPSMYMVTVTYKRTGERKIIKLLKR